jgi:hypothetical protein
VADLVSMEKDDDDVLDHIAVHASLNSKFPYHMRFALTQAEFKKLGLDPTVAKKDDEIEFKGEARITECEHKDGPGGKTCRIEFQIEKFCIETAEEEAAENEEDED